jgi:hypothetical protein
MLRKFTEHSVVDHQSHVDVFVNVVNDDKHLSTGKLGIVSFLDELAGSSLGDHDMDLFKFCFVLFDVVAGVQRLGELHGGEDCSSPGV